MLLHEGLSSLQVCRDHNHGGFVGFHNTQGNEALSSKRDPTIPKAGGQNKLSPEVGPEGDQ